MWGRLCFSATSNASDVEAAVVWSGREDEFRARGARSSCRHRCDALPGWVQLGVGAPRTVLVALHDDDTRYRAGFGEQVGLTQVQLDRGLARRPLADTGQHCSMPSQCPGPGYLHRQRLTGDRESGFRILVSRAHPER